MGDARILIVDDDPGIHEDYRKVLSHVSGEEDGELRDLMQELLGSAPEERSEDDEATNRLEHAYQGQDGYEMCLRAIERGEPYDLAFVDMRMPPGWNGLRTAHELLDADPALRIVICTAYSDHSEGEVRKRLGYSERVVLLKKPFDPAELEQLAAEQARAARAARGGA